MAAYSNNVENLMKKSVIVNGFEKLHNVHLEHQSKKTQKRLRKSEQSKNKGSAWFNLPATKQSGDIKHDLEILRMRSVLDSKRFYKRSHFKNIPKYFQVGHAVVSPLDYYSDHIPKKQRRNTLVEQLMIDAEFKKYNKRKFEEIIKANPKLKRNAERRAKRLKKMKR